MSGLKILVLITLLAFLLLPGDVQASDNDRGQDDHDQGQQIDKQGQDDNGDGSITITFTPTDPGDDSGDT